jgi:uncharacterized OsmC-like protein
LSFKSKVIIGLERLENRDLRIKFDNITMEDLIIKKSGISKEKMGGEARQLLAASLVECMCSTLISLLDWARVDLKMFQADAEVISGKDEEGRLCVDSINMKLIIRIPEDEETLRKFKRAETLFERGCLMSRSLKRGIKVDYSINTQSRKF